MRSWRLTVYVLGARSGDQLTMKVSAEGWKRYQRWMSVGRRTVLELDITLIRSIESRRRGRRPAFWLYYTVSTNIIGAFKLQPGPQIL